MSEHRARVTWRLESADFTYDSYNRDHDWTFKNGAEVRASAAPGFLGNPDLVDPEDAFVASLSSCHMLTFLALAARKRLVVEEYTDDAVGVMEKNEDGRLAVTRVRLRPQVRFSGAAPSSEELAGLHDKAHGHCFIANSVRTAVSVEPR